MGPKASVLLLALLLLLRVAACRPDVADYPDEARDLAELDQWLSSEKRGCVPRGGNCDQKPRDCCGKSSCRCNLWGSNCRCQRMGLFQQWGK